MSSHTSPLTRHRRAMLTAIVLSGVLGATGIEAQDGLAASRSGRFEVRPQVGG